LRKLQLLNRKQKEIPAKKLTPNNRPTIGVTVTSENFVDRSFKVSRLKEENSKKVKTKIGRRTSAKGIGSEESYLPPVEEVKNRGMKRRSRREKEKLEEENEWEEKSRRRKEEEARKNWRTLSSASMKLFELREMTLRANMATNITVDAFTLITDC